MLAGVEDDRREAELLQRLVSKLKSRKASYRLPIGAVKALCADDGTVAMLAAVIGLQVATQRAPSRWGTRLVSHLYKGKGKNALKFESYRPIGLGHAITRLADAVWDYRNGPWGRSDSATRVPSNPTIFLLFFIRDS